MTKKMTFNAWYNAIAKRMDDEPSKYLSWDELAAYHANRTGIAIMVHRLTKLKAEKGEKK